MMIYNNCISSLAWQGCPLISYLTFLFSICEHDNHIGDEGFIGLCKRAKATLVIPPEMGYGSVGEGATIPGGATVSSDMPHIISTSLAIEKISPSIGMIFKKFDQV